MNDHFVLFDLDNTLVDSLHLKPLRDARRWSEVYARISSIKVFDGISATWLALRRRGVFLGIVTHSPRSYASRVLDHVGFTPDALVAYHDLNGKRKPSPYGYEQCCSGRDARLGAAVGDERTDLLAADRFGCSAIFAGWARNPALTAEDCQQAGWLYVSRPRELVDIVLNTRV